MNRNADASNDAAVHPREAVESPDFGESRLRALLEATVDGIISIDSRGRIQTFNLASQRLFGYSAGEVIGQNIMILMPSPYREEHDRYMVHYLTTGEKRVIGIGREVVGLRRDGTTFPMDLSVAEARVGAERIFVGIVRDITARKRMNEEMRTMAQQLWQAAKLASMGELAASIAHELNNPLATVMLRLESVLARTAADDPRRKPLEVVAAETRRMAELVANLLQFSRRGTDQISTVDPRAELAKAVELIDHHLRKRLISVVRDFAPDTPIIYADRQKLRQVFLNLLTNASDAMQQGGTLTLRTAPAMLEDGRSVVSIEFVDTGVGIPRENLGKIMEPFFTTKEEGRGTGLGLAICRRVVQEGQGDIRIASEVGKGTAVRIVLPVKSDANAGRIRGGGLTE